ncbi:MAG: PEP-CTERM sorting domain-containing protein [Planctomycetales bacterium]|nr:PEP-CTERM sorting domain-containing protein [Planctomycetales bacterium]
MKSPLSALRRAVASTAALLVVGAAPLVAHAQTYNSWTAGTANWNIDLNWDVEFQPDFTFDEVANISNGGTALVTSAIATSPGQIVLGRETGETGSVIIQNGGSLSVKFVDGNVSNGGIDVGAAGTGSLTILPGGSLEGRALRVPGNLANSIVLGGAAAGAATLDLEREATIGGALRITGPNVNFSTLGLTLQGTSVYTAEITGAAHSTIVSANTAALDGTLRPVFSGGFTPTAGNAWDLVDAPAITGSPTLDLSGVPSLPKGQVYSFAAIEEPGSVHGVIGRLSVEQRLVLEVDRSTGQLTIASGPAPVSIDGYSIRSALGGLKPAGWNSLQDQGDSDWRESPQGGSSFALSELKPTASKSISATSPVTLGSAFALPTPTEFGTEIEDLTFEYYSAGGVVTQGIVTYSGPKQHNNLVLVVDPNTGAARLENESAISVDIDGYVISSASGSLLAANGSWNSLDDQNAGGGDWRESNPTANQLAELKPTSSTTMTGGINFGFDLGTLFRTASSGGAEDLEFKFLFSGDDEFQTGVVEYRSIASASGDFDNDGDVDGADYALWQAAFGENASGDADGDGDSDGFDFLTWQRQFSGPASAVASAAVPEPTSLLLLLAAAGSLTACGRTRR